MPLEKNTLVAWITTAVIAVAFSTALVLVAWSRPGTSPSGLSGQVTPEGLSSTGEGRVNATPDRAEITLGVESHAPDAAAASDQNNTKANAIIEAIKGLGIRDAEIQTINVGVFPEYDFGDASGTEPKVTGYVATNTVVVKTNSIDKVSDVVDASIDAGSNQVQGINFTFTAELRNKLEEEARRAALEDARSKAEVIAQVSGVSLGKVIAITESSTPEFPIAYAESSSGGGGDVKTTPVEPGTSEVVISVSVTYKID
ncbi:MAG: SIMPL domain-containing protein [Parcubacteria group bacterium]